MIKKRLVDGSLCKKCQQAEDLLKRRGLWQQIEEVVWALENEPSSPGMQLAAKHGVELAPFFLVNDGEREDVYTSVLDLIKQRLTPATTPGSDTTPPVTGAFDEASVAKLNGDFGGAEPVLIVDRVLEEFGDAAVIAFSGAEDVALIDMAVKTGRRFSVMTLDTGRLHPETYRFIDKVRTHYGIEIRAQVPNTVALEQLVRKKGLFSFYNDGHHECCGVRKIEPLRRALGDYRAWLTGQRRDSSPTRTNVALFELDQAHAGASGPLLKANPLAAWSLARTWQYLRDNDVPYNVLHDQGFISIGCEPCTRAIRPGEHERAGRWWWEEATKRECGLHTGK